MTANQRVRFVEFERGEIDMETGEFPMVLATDGEASDGDILSIEGAQFTSRAPLQISHQNDPRATLGSVSGFRRDLTTTPKRLKARGQIELGGDGPTADIRRDLAHMIQNGHVTGISVRWEPLKYTARTALPKEHPAHVGENETDWRKRYGTYHEKWRVLEGSVVAVQADKAAMIGRAEALDAEGGKGEVAAFWRAMAGDARERIEVECEGLAPPPDGETTLTDADLDRSVAEIVDALTDADLDQIEALIDAKRAAAVPTDPVIAALMAQISSLEARLRAQEERVTAAPLPALMTAQDMIHQYEVKLAEARERVLAIAKAGIDARRGKIPAGLSIKDQLHAEVDAVLRKANGQDAANAATADKLRSLVAQFEVLVTAARARAEAAQRDKDNKQ